MSRALKKQYNSRKKKINKIFRINLYFKIGQILQLQKVFYPINCFDFSKMYTFAHKLEICGRYFKTFSNYRV
jgi:hypothetical protein